jgi:hypothetical protein
LFPCTLPELVAMPQLLKQQVDEFKTLHSGVYMGFKSRTRWEARHFQEFATATWPPACCRNTPSALLTHVCSSQLVWIALVVGTVEPIYRIGTSSVAFMQDAGRVWFKKHGE